MQFKKHVRSSSSSSSTGSSTNPVTESKDDNRLKVFILAGQSNMLGKGSIDHLDQLVQHQGRHVHSSNNNNNNNIDCPENNEYRAHLWNETLGTYKVKENVYIRYQTAHGKLTVARDSGYAAPGRFGPELMFGWTVADTDAFRDSTILLIKTAWGGKSLAQDFRPPSSGGWGGGDVGNNNDTTNGLYYRLMIQEINDTLSHLDQYVPTYNTGILGYDILAFVWFQGWNDLPKAHEYGDHLANLIRDVRRDLMKLDNHHDHHHQYPLPVVIGELGMHGSLVLDANNNTATRKKKKGRRRRRPPPFESIRALRSQQQEITLRDEFRNNTIFVPTAPFVVVTTTNDDDDAIMLQKFDGLHHYWGRADTYFHIGQALGRGTLQLLNVPVVPPNQDDPNTRKLLCGQDVFWNWNPVTSSSSNWRRHYYQGSAVLCLFLVFVLALQRWGRALARKSIKDS